jgi:hypothetical protein
MGQNPGADPKATLNSCTQNWQVTNKFKTCVLFYTCVRKLTPAQADAKCTTSSVSRSLKQLQKPLTTPAVHPYM